MVHARHPRPAWGHGGQGKRMLRGTVSPAIWTGEVRPRKTSSYRIAASLRAVHERILAYCANNSLQIIIPLRTVKKQQADEAII